VVEGARDGALGLVILMRVSFSPLLQGAPRCVRKRRREGPRHSLGEGRCRQRRCHRALSLFSPPLTSLPRPQINKVGVVAMVEEFDEDLAPDYPELLPGLALRAYPGAPH
jgi:hypothetical protein